jgi:hypothetical protein
MLDNAVARELLSKSPIPIPVQYVIMYASLLIMIVSGFAMLKGFNWGRLLYVASTSISFLIGLATSPVRAGMIPGIVFFIVVAFFLFRPKASAYFSPAKATDDAQRV